LPEIDDALTVAGRDEVAAGLDDFAEKPVRLLLSRAYRT
jgi:hypothetical protein